MRPARDSLNTLEQFPQQGIQSADRFVMLIQSMFPRQGAGIPAGQAAAAAFFPNQYAQWQIQL